MFQGEVWVPSSVCHRSTVPLISSVVRVLARYEGMREVLDSNPGRAMCFISSLRQVILTGKRNNAGPVPTTGRKTRIINIG